MKRIAFFITFTFICLLPFVSIIAQTAEKTPTPEEKQKEIEVRKFVQEFLQQMDEKKDIRLIPENYLDPSFKKNFTLFLFSANDLPKELSEDERFQNSAEFFNLMYLGLMCMYGNNHNFESVSDDKTENVMKKFLPPNIIDLAKSNRLLKAMIEEKDDDLDKEFENITQIRLLIADLHKINEALKAHIESQPQKWHETYLLKSAEDRKEIDYFKARVCDKEECNGLPEKSIIYHHDLFPYCVEVVERDGSYKIIKINFRMD